VQVNLSMKIKLVSIPKKLSTQAMGTTGGFTMIVAMSLVTQVKISYDGMTSIGDVYKDVFHRYDVCQFLPMSLVTVAHYISRTTTIIKSTPEMS
jgi:hypothetical protein